MGDEDWSDPGSRRAVRRSSPITLRSHEFFLLATGPIRRAFGRGAAADAQSGPLVVPTVSPVWFLTGVITLLAAIVVTALIVDRRAQGETIAHLEVEIDKAASLSTDQAARINSLEREKSLAAATEARRQSDAKERVEKWRAALVPALQRELQRADARFVDDGTKLLVQLSDDLLFDGTRTELRAGGEEALTRVGAVLAALDVSVEVVGHTDDHTARRRRGDDEPARFAPSESLWGLSAARATLAARVLEEQGKVPSSRVTVVARGAQDPVTSNGGPQRRAKNRRLELVLRPL